MTTAPTTEVNNLKAQFADWLASPQTEAFTYQEDNYHYTVLRAAKNADFDYLYCQQNFYSQSIQRNEKFRYAGIFCKADGLVYDVKYELRPLANAEGRSLDDLQNTLRDEVRNTIERTIANDRGNLSIKELDGREAEQLAYFKKSSVADAARRAYLNGEDSSFPYRCHYTPAPWSEDGLLAYISDPAAYAQREAAAFIAGNQEAMLKAFLENDATREAYRAIVENPQHQAHCVKRIIAAATDMEAKTFRVTIRRDGKEFNFKTEADDLRYDHKYYSSWDIAAADRREFERRFGRNSNYYPEEIMRIAYGRAVLYEAGT